MKNTHKVSGNVSGESKVKQSKKADITKLPRMEMYAVLGLELNKQIIDRLNRISLRLKKAEDSLNILARQKKRELTPEPPQEQPAKSSEQADT
jgi:hypothetical protein